MRLGILTALRFLFLVLPIAALFLNGRLWKTNYRNPHFLLIVLFLTYLLYLVLSMMGFTELKSQLDQFDLNGDGYLSISEETDDALNIQTRLRDNEGRTLLPLFGIVVASAWVGVSYLMFVISRWIVSRFRSAT